MRQFTNDDLENVFFGLSHPQVIKYYGVSYNTLEETKDQISFFKKLEQEEIGIWWAIESLDNKFIGAGGLNNLSKIDRNAEIGFWLLPEYWRKGIMLEAMSLIIEYALNDLNLHRLVGYIETENLACKKAIAKLNFQHEGTLRDCEWKNGKFISLDVYSKINENG